MKIRSLLIVSILLVVCSVDAKRRRPRPTNDANIDRLPALCNGHESLCSAPEHQAMMNRLCAKTCKGAGEKSEEEPKEPQRFSCANPQRDVLERECPRKSHLCGMPDYRRMIAKYCCKTCSQFFANRTPSTTPASADSKGEKAVDPLPFAQPDEDEQ